MALPILLSIFGAFAILYRSPWVRAAGFSALLVSSFAWICQGMLRDDAALTVQFLFYGAAAVAGLLQCLPALMAKPSRGKPNV